MEPWARRFQVPRGWGLCSPDRGPGGSECSKAGGWGASGRSQSGHREHRGRFSMAAGAHQPHHPRKMVTDTPRPPRIL